MKKIITTTGLLITTFFALNATAQRWERGREEDSRNYHHSEKRIVYRGEENKRDYCLDERREEHENYYRNDREYARNEPRIVYNREYRQPQRVGYFYYPSANVYYNPVNRLYTFPFRGQWVSSEVLPHGFYINESYQEVYCNVGENICVYNNFHRNAFKSNVEARHCAPIQFRLAVRF